MKLNNKAQAITNPWIIIFIVIVIALFSGYLLTFGQDLASDPNNKLNQESVSYIFNKSSFQPVGTDITTNDSTDLFFTSDIDTEGNLKDYALEFQFYREQSSGIRGILQSLWNVPTFFVDGLGLDTADWEAFSTLVNTLVWTILLLGIWAFLRGK